MDWIRERASEVVDRPLGTTAREVPGHERLAFICCACPVANPIAPWPAPVRQGYTMRSIVGLIAVSMVSSAATSTFHHVVVTTPVVGHDAATTAAAVVAWRRSPHFAIVAA